MKIAILCRSLGKQCGIAEYALTLGERLDAMVVSDPRGVVADVVLVQYEPSLYHGVPDVMKEVRTINGATVVIDVHTELPDNIVRTLTVNGIEYIGVKTDPRKGVWHLPHVAYPPEEFDDHVPAALRLGSFGFALPNKNYERLLWMSYRLQIPVLILASLANANSTVEWVSSKYIKYLQFLTRDNDLVEIIGNFLTRRQIVEKLRTCTHLVSTMGNLGRASGSMRMMALAGRPIISLPCLGAREVRAITVGDLDDITLDFLSLDHQPPKVLDGLVEYKKLLSRIQENLDVRTA